MGAFCLFVGGRGSRGSEQAFGSNDLGLTEVPVFLRGKARIQRDSSSGPSEWEVLHRTLTLADSSAIADVCLGLLIFSFETSW